MEVVLAKSAGFCFGVKRAMEEVYSQLENGKKIVTYGPLIHNEEVVKDLAQRGVDVIDGEEELEALAEGAVVIRSHGVSKHIYELIEQKGLECIDVTCPFVKRIHRIVERESKEGKQIVIIGNPGHPEVEGIRGWSMTPAVVLETKEEAENFRAEEGKTLCIVSQTTFNYKKFNKLVEGYNVSDRVKVLEYTDKVPELMHISSIVVTKPGGLTTTESLASGLPIIVVNPIPGQEEENADFLVRNGVAIWIKDDDNVARILKNLYRHPEVIDEMRSHIPELAKPNSTEDICNVLINTL